MGGTTSNEKSHAQQNGLRELLINVTKTRMLHLVSQKDAALKRQHLTIVTLLFCCCNAFTLR